MEAIYSCMDYMNMNGLEDDYEIVNGHTFKFFFYDVNELISFLTNEYNCMTEDSKMDLIDWFKKGICLWRLSECTKNRNIFKYIAFESFCIYCQDSDLVNNEDDTCHAVTKMNPLEHKVIVEYNYNDFDHSFTIYIRMPMICRYCSPTSTFIPRKKIHEELYLEIEEYRFYHTFTCCHVTNYMNSYRLQEPHLKKQILSYLDLQ